MIIILYMMKLLSKIMDLELIKTIYLIYLKDFIKDIMQVKRV